MNLLQQLAKLEKQQVRYKNEEYYIKSYSLERGLITIQTNKESIFINDNEFKPSAFEIMNQEQVTPTKQQEPVNPYLEPVQPTKTVISGAEMDIKGIIENNIKRIQEDKGYIEQAGAINDQIKTLIDLAKTQILASKVK